MGHTTRIRGKLEIDHDRGVLYFHADTGWSALRICQLPAPIMVPHPGEPIDLVFAGTANYKLPEIAGFCDQCEEPMPCFCSRKEAS